MKEGRVMGMFRAARDAVFRSVDRAFGLHQRALSLEDVWGDWVSTHQMDVARDNALRLIPVYAAVAYIADMLACLPVDFGRKAAGVRRPVDPPSWWTRPDSRISRFDWMFQLAASVLLRGNAYGLVVYVNGVIDQIRWIHPDRVTVDESGPFPEYVIAGDTKRSRLSVNQGGEILHIRGFLLPGTVVGLNPIERFRFQLETMRGSVEYGRDWFDNAMLPSGILKNDKQSLDPEQTDQAKRRLVAAVRRGEPLALDANWSWEQLSVKPADAEWLASIKAGATQVGVIFRVDPEEIGGETGNSLRYSTVEGNQRKFNVRTLLPWCVRFESAFEVLLSFSAIDEMKFNLDALARPDTLTRAKVTTEELRNGTLTLDEGRVREDRPPLTGDQVDNWQRWYATAHSSSESVSQALESLAPPQED